MILLQRKILEWARLTFGPVATNKNERALRLAEEAVELAQSVGVERWQVLRLVWSVYSSPAGIPEAELGGVAVTVLAAAEVLGLEFTEAATKELARISTKKVTARCKAHQKERRAALLTGDEFPDEKE
jgi:NTP pyrophosphatase (non-canonical NTP hydrolase)